MVANMVFNLILVLPLHLAHTGGHIALPVGHVGLALATSLAAWLNAGLLAKGLLRKDIFEPQAGWREFAGKLILATLAMALLLWLANPAVSTWQPWSWWQRVAVLIALCGAGFALYVGAMAAFGLRVRHLRGPAV
jgi:putative peptidoglycan lipid II flippase